MIPIQIPRLARFSRLSPIIVGIAAVIGALAGTFGASSDTRDPPWRLIRSANPNGGADAVAMMHIADASKSDLGLAGLMLRCSEHDLEVVVVATVPFAPRVHPHVKLRAGKTESAFDASVVPPLSALLLPSGATALVGGAWQSAPELLIEIEDQQTVIRGAVALAGLKAAAVTLRANCPLR